VPWRKLGLWGLVAALVIGAAAAIALPRINDAKRKGAAERAREQAVAVAAETARLRADQAVHRLTIPAGADTVAALESAITSDARARARAKTISGPVVSTSCQAATGNAVQFAGSRVYKCFVKTSAGFRGQGQDVLGTGYPFIATIYPKRHSAAWCKQNPRADEKGSRGMVHVQISPVCAGKLSQVL
jgi:type II secretory pathway pseudopilin PulG